jgi:MOSC domain-containing protein YiiM
LDYPAKWLGGGEKITNAIYKQPVGSPVALRKPNLEGDRRADLSVHGGEHKAVYCYPLKHYDYWRRELPGRELPMGLCGESFITDGLLEDSVQLGDQFAVGSAEVVVTQPHPLLQARCEISIRRHGEAILRRTGFCLGVAREAEVGAGDEIKVIARDRTASRSRKSLVCALRKGKAIPTWPRCGAPCELSRYLKVGRSTFEGGWGGSMAEC